MNEKRKIRGLFDILDAEHDGVEWEMEEPSADFMPGMGFGATDQAKRWAYIGYLMEMRINGPVHQQKEEKRGRGQPQKSKMGTNDALRALLLYMAAERYRIDCGLARSAKLDITVFQLVARAKGLWDTRDLFEKPNSQNKMYASIKRGRKILGIDDYWRGKPVQEILESPFNSE